LHIGSLFLSFITAGNFWLNTTSYNLHLKIEALGARKRTQLYFLDVSSFAIPQDVIQKKSLNLQLLPVARGKINHTFSEKIPSYGNNEFIFKTLGIDFIHSKGLYGQDIVVGVFDTGFDSTHPAIKTIFDEHRVIAQYDFNSGDHLFLKDNEIQLSDSIIYLNGFDIADSFAVVSYVPIDILALNDNGYRVVILHNGEKELVSINERGIKPRIRLKQDTLFIVYEVIRSGFMQIQLAKRSPEGAITKISLTDNTVDNIYPDMTFKDDTIFVYYINSSGILKSGVFNNTVVFTDTIFKKPDLSYLKVYDNYAIYATFDSIGILTLSDTPEIIFETEGFYPGFNPACGLFYYSDSTGTWEYDIHNNSLRFLTSSILTSPPVFNGDSLIFATFNNYNAYIIQHGKLTEIHRGLTDLVSASGSSFLIRQRGDEDVTPDVKNDYNMHGTEMLSLIGGFWEGKITGIAPLARFVLCKTERGASPDGHNFENQIEEDFWAEALEFAIDNGAQVVSSSLGYKDWYSKSQLDGKYPISSRMASKALSLGVLVINAMGNDTHEYIPENGDTSLVAPADAHNILAVGGCDSTCTEPANCSYGPAGDGRIKPEIVAPFNAYWADSDGTIYRLGGTSVSTAIVAGIVASLWSADPEMDADYMRSLIIKNATQLPGYNTPNNITGYGRIDPVKVYNVLPFKEAVEKDVEFLNPYPNPARVSQNREIILPLKFVHRGDGIIKILTANGKTVRTIKFYERGPGILTFPVSIKDLSPGLYIAFCHTTFKSARTKFIVLP